MTSYLSISHLILKRKMQCKDCKFFYNNFPLVIMNTREIIFFQKRIRTCYLHLVSKIYSTIIYYIDKDFTQNQVSGNIKNQSEDSMKIKITGIIIMVIFAGTLIFYTCGKSQPQTDNQIYIGVACYDQKDTFIEELVDAFKEQCSSMESKDYAISMTIMDASNSQRVQNDQIEQMINDGCNVLCVNLADRTEPSEIIDAAKEKDIPIIFFNREPVEEDMRRWDKLYYVGGKAKQSGELQGELAADFIKVNPQADRNNDGKIQYVILEGEMGHQDAIIRTESVVESLKANDISLEKLSYQIANWNRAQAQTRMMQLIGQYKTNIEMVIANSDSMALGAIDAYEKLGYTESNIPVFFGIDGTDEGLEAVQKGKIAATVYNDKEGQAKAMAELVIAAVTGKEMEDIQFENNRCIYLPYKKVTKENVETMIK